MGSQLDEHGQKKRWSLAKPKAKASTYSSGAKKREMEKSQLLASGGRYNAQAALARPYKTPTFVNGGAQTKPVRLQDQLSGPTKSTFRTSKSEHVSEDEENQSSRVKARSPSSDEEDHSLFNDIPPTNFKKKNDPQNTARGGRANIPRKIPGRVEFSETSSPEPEREPRTSKPSASRLKSGRSEREGIKKEPAIIEDEPKRVFKSFAVTPWEEPENNAGEPRPEFKTISRPESSEPETEKKKFFKPVKENESDDDHGEEKKKAFRRAAILEECGGSPTSIKRSLIVAGLGTGLDEIDNDDLGRSPLKKIATANKGLSGLAARVAGPRIKEEDTKEEEIDDTHILLDVDEATCPMCHKSIPHSLLMSFSNNRPRSLNTRQQAAFCVHHKRDSALTRYTSLGYPNISWNAFTSRLTPHYTYISSLIKSPETTPSHYRPLFTSDITHGRNRTLKQSIMGTKGEGSSTARILIPGYYGPRGAQAMQQAILLKFNRELRRAAVEDHVVSARAVGGYVASVLVPELGTRLIMEDLKIGEEEARKVMEQSAALGSLVNEEMKDVRSEADRGVDEGGDYD